MDFSKNILTKKEAQNEIKRINELNFFPLTEKQEKSISETGSFTSNETKEQKIENLIMHVFRYYNIKMGDPIGKGYVAEKEFCKEFIPTHGFILRDFITLE